MALERVAKHEGAHMGHRRILEHRAIQNGEQDAKEVSERRLEKYYKTHPGLVEKFANRYAGLESANVSIAGFLFGTSTASLPIFVNNAVETAPLSGRVPKFREGRPVRVRIFERPDFPSQSSSTLTFGGWVPTIMFCKIYFVSYRICRVFGNN
jgi:hypothetical protein